MELPDRRSRRLHSHDYSRAGVYFVTVYANQGREHFGGIAEGSIALNAAGHAIGLIWKALPQRFPALTLDAFVMMPNHLHGIMRLSGERGTHLGEVVGAFKSLSTVEYIRLVNDGRCERFAGKLWHRNYYDAIIRDAGALAKVRAYIARNPEVWVRNHARPCHLPARPQ